MALEGGARCPACGGPRPGSARFCPACGTPFALGACAACGEPLLPAARFCASCGTSVEATTSVEQPGTLSQGRGAVAERRLTSVLFGDLVGFTTLSECRDPEQ